jgi:pimeloyl-ACP methyl ester carboxylesterase
MPSDRFNDVRLYYDSVGGGDPMVFVHGSWTDHHTWDAVAPLLSNSFKVITYDRRGHSESERPSGQGNVRQDVADLAAVIETLGPAPVHVAGNSFGAVITLRLAIERPDLFRSVMLHEPPLLGLLADDPESAPVLEESGRRIGSVVERIASGDHAGAARQFIEEVALGPGQWDALPAAEQQTLIANAPTFLDETKEGPEALTIDLDPVSRVPIPTLLSRGDHSPPFFPIIMAKLAAALPAAEQRLIAGAGHVPHATHPAQYAEMVRDFCMKSG